MPNFNLVVLTGHLTRDPETRYTPSGTAVTTIGLAVNHRYGQGEEKKEEVCFVDVVTFGKQAEFVAQWFAKGGAITVQGRLSQNRWETEDGQKRSKHEVVAEKVFFAGQKQEGGE